VNLFALDTWHGCTVHIQMCFYGNCIEHTVYTVGTAPEVLSQATDVTSEEIQGSLQNDSPFTPVVV
jgi:hypothetical protein